VAAKAAASRSILAGTAQRLELVTGTSQLGKAGNRDLIFMAKRSTSGSSINARHSQQRATLPWVDSKTTV
jgi:hypothetical protein